LPGIQLGQLLVEQGVLTEQQVQHILKVQKISHRPFGDLAERLFGIDARAVEDAWVEQYVRITGVVDLENRKSTPSVCVYSTAARHGNFIFSRCTGKKTICTSPPARKTS